VRQARDTTYDAILMDIHLSDEASGVDVMEHLRSMPEYRHTPIIALTAFALPGDRERFLSAGFSGYLGKPFTKPQLEAALAEALGGEAEPPSNGRESIPEAPPVAAKDHVVG
jgi:CheY-like chemotaxis protein